MPDTSEALTVLEKLTVKTVMMMIAILEEISMMLNAT
jgi:hypothetical protein